jgi:hypothetical protein
MIVEVVGVAVVIVGFYVLPLMNFALSIIGGGVLGILVAAYGDCLAMDAFIWVVRTYTHIQLFFEPWLHAAYARWYGVSAEMVPYLPKIINEWRIIVEADLDDSLEDEGSEIEETEICVVDYTIKHHHYTYLHDGTHDATSIYDAITIAPDRVGVFSKFVCYKTMLMATIGYTNATTQLSETHSIITPLVRLWGPLQDFNLLSQNHTTKVPVIPYLVHNAHIALKMPVVIWVEWLSENELYETRIEVDACDHLILNKLMTAMAAAECAKFDIGDVEQ